MTRTQITMLLAELARMAMPGITDQISVSRSVPRPNDLATLARSSAGADETDPYRDTWRLEQLGMRR